MDETPWSLLDRLPLSEIRRRSRILAVLSESEGASIDGADLMRWDSGGGDHASWLFHDDGRALLLVFDNKSRLNLFSDDESDAQRSMYEGVPDDLLNSVRGLPDEEPFLMLGPGAEAMPAASGVFWCDGASWRPASGLEALIAERGLDLIRDSGVAYCTSWYLLGREFTPETLIAKGAERKFGVDRERLTAVFAAAAP